MNWNKIDLTSPCERNANLIEGLTFETLLLEVHCNLPIIDAKTIKAQFEEDLMGRVEEAKRIFAANLKAIVKQAKKERAIK
jgi:hypothetical protein